jgi:tRNA A-37 threonylcarbamoyl transferase component Bud32/DNA-binding response OmpR family regulator
MRLLHIDDDPRYRALLRHHVTCDWPDADLLAYNPVVRGRMPKEFLAQGFDAVLLDHTWKGGAGIDWLRGLSARPGFAPIIFMVERADDPLVGAALAAGACAVIAKSKIDHDRLSSALQQARARQRAALAAWRDSSEGRASQQFGATRIAGYRCIRQLAVGSVSQLYLAESFAAGTLVVLKVTPVKRLESGIDQSYERFVQEFEIVKRVRHPSVVRLYDLGVAPDHAYLVMEYFREGDLRRRMRERISPRDALKYAHEMALALGGIHAAGVLHRDLKPGNIMLRDDGSLALIDFGLAKHHAVNLEITDAGLIFGTPHYMSPEQGHGEPIDARSDLYSLGVILYEMLTARKPFDADKPMSIIYKHRKHPVPPLGEGFEVFQPMIDRLLAKTPPERFSSAQEAAAAMQELLAAMQLEAAPA